MKLLNNSVRKIVFSLKMRNFLQYVALALLIFGATHWREDDVKMEYLRVDSVIQSR